ncbi:antA/AntB antirepressor family protein, partial [Staphylococcus haemolyticus]|uniref:antA/AntB antirepressor family protein n=1 Tax=Staphylococcus haemolyticus TaxID=1283 RepID=UPI0015D66808
MIEHGFELNIDYIIQSDIVHAQKRARTYELEIHTPFNFKHHDHPTLAVSGRALHKGSAIGTRYDQWIERMIEYGFEANIDYIIQSEIVHGQKRARTYDQENHIMTLDMA